MIKDVKIMYVDNDSLFGARILKVETSKNSFKTPSRVLTSTENRYKKDLTMSPLDDRGNLPITTYEYIKGFRNEDTLKKLHKTNGFLKEQLRQIDNNLRGYDDVLTLTTFQYPSNIVLTKDDIKALIYLQCRSIADCVSMPETAPNVSTKMFLQMLEQSSKFIERSGKEPVPTIHMGNKNRNLFCEKMNAIVKAEFRMVTLKYASFDMYYSNYEYVQKIAEEHNILFHITGVPRVIPRSHANYVHIPQIFKIDMSSPKTPLGGGEIKPQNPVTTRRFDSFSLGNLHLSEHIEEYGNKLFCSCPICKNKNVDDYIKDYSNCPNNKVINPIYLYSRMHEIFASANEFQQGRRYIRKARTDEYITNKKYTKGIITKLGKMVSKNKQTTLQDY